MPQEVSLLIQSQSNTTGLSKVTSGLKDLESGVASASDQSEKLGMNYEALGKKMERPLGRVAFHGLASDILGANGAMEKAGSATGALTSGLHALGDAAIFAGGEFAMIAIGAVAVYEIYEKLHSRSVETTADFKTNLQSMIENRESMKGLVEDTSKYISLTVQEKNAIIENTGALKKQIIEKANSAKLDAESTKDANDRKIAALDAYEAAKKGNTANEVYRNSLAGLRAQGLQVIDIDKQRASITEKNSEATLKLAAANNLLNEMDKKDSGKKNDSSLINEVNDAIMKRNASMKSSITIMESLQVQEGKLSNAEKQFIATTDPIKKKSLADEIQGLNKKIQAERETLNKSREIEKQEEAVLKKRAASYDKYLSAAADSVEAHGKKIVFNGKQFLGEELKDAANQAATYLEIQAAKYFGSGNYAMGAAALAAAAAVKLAAAAGAALLESSDSGGDINSSSSSSTASDSTLSDSSNTTSSQGTTLTINVSAMHVGSTASLAKFLGDVINEGVSQNNVKIKATQIVGRGGAFVTG
jgi:hypothetical protein